MATDSIPREILISLLESVQKYPVGARFTDGDGTYTVVANELHGRFATPLMLLDESEDFLGIREVGELTPAPDDPEMVKQALALARKERDYLSQHGIVDLALANPADVEQLEAVLKFGQADREWRIAEAAQIAAAQSRAMRIAETVWTSDDNQSHVARLLGFDQSRVSRAVETARQLTGYYRP